MIPSLNLRNLRNLRIVFQRSLAVSVAVVILAAATVNCGSDRPSPSGPSAAPTAAGYSTYQSAHLTLRYTAIDAATIANTATQVEAEYARITDDLGVSDMPTVTVTLYASSDALRSAVGSVAGPLPAFAKGLVTGPTTVHILSPNLRTAWSYAEAIPNIVHEFAHCVSLRLNPTFANSPRWLWESVALFEALQYDDMATRSVVTAGPLPPLAQLNSFDNTLIYGLGAWLGSYIRETRGSTTYRDLIRANGDIGQVLGATETAFLTDWAAWVRANIRP